MQVSVVVCTYDPALYGDCCEAADSVLEQTHGDVELVVVVDGDQDYCERIRGTYGDDDRVTIECNDENLGLSRSRNVGIEHATGDVVAFMDDDAVAHDDWVEELIATYERHDAIAAGGRMAPRWIAEKPAFLPEEFYWLIGVTHKGFPEEECEVRNTFGSNISFRRKVLKELGGFEPELGIVGDKQVQGEETELAARMQEEFGEGVWYNPDAIVEHKIFEERTEVMWLIKRAFWQGYSKRVMESVLPDTDNDEEGRFLRQIASTFVPARIRSTASQPGVVPLGQLLLLLGLTVNVGLGYLYGIVNGAMTPRH